jgi:hypothetical protein
VNEPVRLLDGSGSEKTRAILRAGLADAPRPDALPRVATALGVSAGALAIAMPATALMNGAAVAGAVAAGAKVPVAAASSVVVLSKWLVAGVLGGAVVSGAALVVERARGPSLPEQTTPVEPVSTTARAVQRRSPLALNPVPETPEPPATPSAQAEMPWVAPKTPAPPPSVADSMGREAARIDAARRAIARGELAQASRELDLYQEERSLGVLDREALLLRIQLLVQRGEHERAVLLARSYLSAHPNDAHTARLRALVDTGGRTWPGPQGIER